MLEKVSLLINKMQHLEVCKTLWKIRFDEVNNKVLRKGLLRRTSFDESIQVQVV
jgi:hypothetical protein